MAIGSLKGFPGKPGLEVVREAQSNFEVQVRPLQWDWVRCAITHFSQRFRDINRGAQTKVGFERCHMSLQ